MNNRSLEIFRTTHEGELIIATVSYPTAKDVKRQYSLHVQPYESVTSSDGYVMTRYTPSRGYRCAIEESPRFSAKRLDALTSDPRVTSMVQQMVDRVIADKATSPMAWK
jgi:hypothetical protein